ncbi:unnamed protein product [Prunus armeniaca]
MSFINNAPRVSGTTEPCGVRNAAQVDQWSPEACEDCGSNKSGISKACEDCGSSRLGVSEACEDGIDGINGIDRSRVGCNLCQKTVKVKEGLIKHQKVQHDKVAKLKYGVCKSLFVSLPDLANHKKNKKIEYRMRKKKKDMILLLVNCIAAPRAKGMRVTFAGRGASSGGLVLAGHEIQTTGPFMSGQNLNSKPDHRTFHVRPKVTIMQQAISN